MSFSPFLKKRSAVSDQLSAKKEKAAGERNFP
jgi:hypothetical protein